jgi:uncharacterized protein involved in type VI secretion and phage assembly
MAQLYDLASMFAEQLRTAEYESTRVYEPMIALVTDNKDPSKLGRVKIKFPVLSDKDTSWWAPIIMLGAGKNRGWLFIPEINDEVLVIFEHGEHDKPLVVGALWNGKDKPHDSNPDPFTNDHRVIKSRQGSRILLDDGGEPKIVIEDGTGKGRITIDTKNNKIIIEALEGDVCFQSPTGDTKIVAKSAEFKATQNLEIHAGAAMAWGTDASAKIDGGPSVTMSGSTANLNCGNSSSPTAPTADPKDADDPHGS